MDFVHFHGFHAENSNSGSGGALHAGTTGAAASQSTLHVGAESACRSPHPVGGNYLDLRGALNCDPFYVQ